MRNLVERIMNKHGTNNPFTIAENENIIVRSAPLGKCHGYYLSIEGIRVIRYNSDDPEPVQRYTVAHELGHCFLHAEANFFALKNTLFSSGWQERQADKFAIHLLITNDDLTENPQYTVDDWSKVLGIDRKLIELRF